MKSLNSIPPKPSLYAHAWQSVGPGMLVALMFVIVAAAAMFREQTAVAGISGVDIHGGLVFDQGLNSLHPGQNRLFNHSVQLQLSLENLRDSDGRLTPNGESLFLLLARRMKSLSLNIMFTAHSIDDARFATTIAALMMREVPLQSTQLRISSDAISAVGDTPGDSVFTITITRHETVDGDAE